MTGAGTGRDSRRTYPVPHKIDVQPVSPMAIGHVLPCHCSVVLIAGLATRVVCVVLPASRKLREGNVLDPWSHWVFHHRDQTDSSKVLSARPCWKLESRELTQAVLPPRTFPATCVLASVILSMAGT